MPKDGSECGRGTARKGREREERGRGSASKGRISSAVASRFSGIIIIISLFFLFFLYFILSSLMASFSCSTYPKKVAHNSEDILPFRNSSHIHRQREKGEGKERGTDQMQRLMQLPVCVFN